ncbi:major facilitator superfamily domain-containing protein [Colletotrichum lupini]|nr:major facilitator superfamily domain-containing protein [Colletotrichum lupini]
MDSRPLTAIPTPLAVAIADREKLGQNEAIHVAQEASRDQKYSVFSQVMRKYLTYLLGLILTLSTLTATIYFPLIPMLSAELGVSIQAINLTVTVYVVVQAVSPAFFASLADAVGRRPVLLGLIALYTVATLGLILSFTFSTGRNGYNALVALRALQSLAAVCLLLTGFTLPETARNVVGNGSLPASGVWRTWVSLPKAFKDGEDRGSDTPQSQAQASQDYLSQKPVLEWQPLQALDSFRIIFYPEAAAVLWMIASSYSVYYTFQVAIPVVFSEVYEYNELQIGIVLLPGLAGMTLGGILAGKLLDRNFATIARKLNLDISSKTAHASSHFPLEVARYRGCEWFLLFMTACVVGYGWAVKLHVHAAVPIVLQFFICAASTLLSHTASTLLVDTFAERPSTTYASAQIARCGLSALSSALLQPLVEAIGRGWYFTIFILFISISGLLSMVVSRTKGVGWRQRRREHIRANDSL